MKDSTSATQAENQAKMESLQRLAWLLDSSIKIPGTNRTIGLDGIIGLVPGIGDAFASLLSGYIVVKALLMGLPLTIIGKMLVNTTIEGIIGIIPFFGDIFDLVFKSNRRNVKLMQDFLDSPEDTKQRSLISLVVLFVVLILILFFMLWMIIKAIAWVFGLIFA